VNPVQNTASSNTAKNLTTDFMDNTDLHRYFFPLFDLCHDCAAEASTAAFAVSVQCSGG
jgi:hypothetical protein